MSDFVMVPRPENIESTKGVFEDIGAPQGIGEEAQKENAAKETQASTATMPIQLGNKDNSPGMSILGDLNASELSSRVAASFNDYGDRYFDAPNPYDGDPLEGPPKKGKCPHVAKQIMIFREALSNDAWSGDRFAIIKSIIKPEVAIQMLQQINGIELKTYMALPIVDPVKHSELLGLSEIPNLYSSIPVVTTIFARDDFDVSVVDVLAKYKEGLASIIGVLKGNTLSINILKILVSSDLVRKDQGTMNTIIEQTAFNVDLVNAFAQYADGLIAIRNIPNNISVEKLRILMSSEFVRKDHATVYALINKDNFDVSVVDILAKDKDGLEMIKAVPNNIGVEKLRILMSSEFVRKDHATVYALINKDNFDVSVVDILAKDKEGLEIIKNVPDDLDPDKLKVLLSSDLVKKDQETINALIRKANFDSSVAEVLAKDETGLQAIQNSPKDLEPVTLQAFCGADSVRKSQTTVNSIVGRDKFDVSVVYALAQNALGLAAIRKTPIDLSSEGLQIFASCLLVQQDQDTVDAIVSKNNFNLSVVNALATYEAGLKAIRGTPIGLSKERLEILTSSALVRQDQVTVQSILLKLNFDSDIMKNLMQNNDVLCKAIAEETGLDSAKIDKILTFPCVNDKSAEAKAVVVALGSSKNLTDGNDNALADAIGKDEGGDFSFKSVIKRGQDTKSFTEEGFSWVQLGWMLGSLHSEARNICPKSQAEIMNILGVVYNFDPGIINVIWTLASMHRPEIDAQLFGKWCSVEEVLDIAAVVADRYPDWSGKVMDSLMKLEFENRKIASQKINEDMYKRFSHA